MNNQLSKQPLMNKNSRTINAGRNVISSFINKLVLLVLAFISRRFFIQYIGVEYLGISGLFSNILTLLSVAELGLGTAMNVKLYKPIANNDIKQLAAILSFFKKIYYVVAIAVFVVGASLLPFLKYIVNTDRDIPHLHLYYLVLLITNVGSYLFVYKSSIINADQRNYLVNRVEVFTTLGITVLKILLILLFKNFLLYLIVDFLRVLAHNITVSIVADKKYPFIKHKEELTNQEKKEFKRDVIAAFFYKFSKTVINSTDNILISILIGTIVVGYYYNYYTVTSYVESFVVLFFSALTSSVGNLIAKESKKKSLAVFKVVQMSSFWLGTLCSVCMYFLFQDFITLWLGKEMLLDQLTLFSIVLCFYVNINLRPLIAFRDGTGMYNRVVGINILAALINIGLSIVLSFSFGLSGIFFATSISKLLTYFWYEPVVLYRDIFNSQVKSYFLSFMFNLLLSSFCFFICYCWLELLPQSNIFIWIIKGLFCFSIVNIVYYLFYKKSNEFLYLKKVFSNFIHRGKNKRKINA